MAKNDSTFVKVTNQMIYDEIQTLKKLQLDYARTNSDEHGGIISRQDKTNGKVKLSMWAATTALSISIILIGFIINFLTK